MGAARPTRTSGRALVRVHDEGSGRQAAYECNGCRKPELGGRTAGGETGESFGLGPIVAGERLDQLGGVRRPDVGTDGQFRGGLVTDMAADRAAILLVGVPVPDDLGGLGTGQRDRQNGDPGAPTKATSYQRCVHGDLLKVSLGGQGSAPQERRRPLQDWPGARPARLPARRTARNSPP